MASMLRDIEAINSGAQTRGARQSDRGRRPRRRSLAHFTGDRARDAFGAVDRALFALERNAGAKVVTEWLAVQI